MSEPAEAQGSKGISRADPIIREAVSADVTGLAEIYIDDGRHHASIDPFFHQVPDIDGALARIRDKLADSTTVLFAAEEDGEIVGLLEVKLASPPPEGAILRRIRTAEVGVAVRENRRNRGLGSALMRFAERWARDNRCKLLLLSASAANAGALRLYQRLGYDTYGLILGKKL
jgi:GNAT superfamily N-acetyltransferase